MPSFLEQISLQLNRDEGFRSKVYRDNSEDVGFEGKKGKLTIGYGRNLEDKGLTNEEADYLRDNDIVEVQTALHLRFPWTLALEDVRLGVLVNMCFNMGLDRLAKFKKTLAAVQAGDYALAATEMEQSAWYSQVGARAARLVLQMKTGVWQ